MLCAHLLQPQVLLWPLNYHCFTGGAEGGLLFVPMAHHKGWYSRLSLASLGAHPDPGLRAPLWHPLKEKSWVGEN